MASLTVVGAIRAEPLQLFLERNLKQAGFSPFVQLSSKCLFPLCSLRETPNDVSAGKEQSSISYNSVHREEE